MPQIFNFIVKETPLHVFSYEFGIFTKNTFLKEDLQATVSIDIRKNINCLEYDVATKLPQTHLRSMTKLKSLRRSW